MNFWKASNSPRPIIVKLSPWTLTGAGFSMVANVIKGFGYGVAEISEIFYAAANYDIERLNMHNEATAEIENFTSGEYEYYFDEEEGVE